MNYFFFICIFTLIFNFHAKVIQFLSLQPISNQRMKYGSLTRLLTVLALPIFIDTLLVMTLGAAGDIYYPVTVGMIVCWTVAVGGSWVLGIGLHGGLIALWFAMVLDENIRGLIFIRRWKSRRWTTKSLI